VVILETRGTAHPPVSTVPKAAGRERWGISARPLRGVTPTPELESSPASRRCPRASRYAGARTLPPARKRRTYSSSG
jgi:hypothetical protein